MMRVGRPVGLPWVEGRFWEVPHCLGDGASIVRVDIPADVKVPPQVIGHHELARAERVRDPAERAFLLGSHAVLRGVLGAALGRPAAELAIHRDAFGKPRLSDGSLCFNMSRSRSAVLIGLSNGADIGVDIELVREIPDAGIVSRECFSSSEYAQWQMLDPAAASNALLQCWTRKEACAKAAGIGLSSRFAQIDVGWRPDRAPEQLDLMHGASQWSIRVVSLPMPPNLVAAAAVTGQARVRPSRRDFAFG